VSTQPTGVHALGFSLVAIVLCSAMNLLASEEGRFLSIQDLTESSKEYDTKTVLVQGKVSSVSYRPEIRDGFSVYSFAITDDQERTIRVMNPMASLFSTGDIVKISGIFHEPNEIDATEGNIEILEGSDSELSRLYSQNRSLSSVPVSPVDTPWTRSDQISSILSALFALFGFIAISLRLRRFNLGLSFSVSSARLGLRREGDQDRILLLVVRAISTHSAVPQISAEVSLRMGQSTFKATSVQREYSANGVISTRDVAPIPVMEPVFLELQFRIPEAQANTIKKRRLKIIFRDALCRKKFVAIIESKVVVECDKPIRDSFRVSPGGSLLETSEEGSDSWQLRGSSRILLAVVIIGIILISATRRP